MLIKIAIVVCLGLFLGTVVEKVYTMRNEICMEKTEAALAEEKAQAEAPRVQDNFSMEKAEEVYNQGITYATNGLVEIVRKFKCVEPLPEQSI